MTIAYLYYDFLNLYGESGNIKIIENVLKLNRIKYKILYLSLEDELDFNSYDLVYIGSGTESNLNIALDHLKKYKNDIKRYIENNKFILVTGNSLDMFGKTIDLKKSLGVFDYNAILIDRIKDEVYINSNVTSDKIIGFRNGCYELDRVDYPLFDNEGVHYNNFFGTHILGPILVRNPEFLKYFMNRLTHKKLKYDLKIETKAYKTFISNFKEKVYE